MSPFNLREQWPLALAASAVVGAVAFAAVQSVSASERGDQGLVRTVQAAFPNTHVSSVRCGIIPGLCEVTAGKTVFYVSPDGRYAMVGSLLDLKGRIDLTDRRMKELGQLDAVMGRLADQQAPGAAPASAVADQTQGGQPPGLGPIKIELPADNGIVHNPGAPLKVSAVTDLNCGYCRMLMESMKSATDIQLTEYPIQLLRPDSADKAKLALCAKDRAATANSIYFGGDLKVSGDCTKAQQAVEANTAFARAHGIAGTPLLIRSDGQTHAGFMPIDQLRAWLKPGQA